jgi:hypothetical protein
VEADDDVKGRGNGLATPEPDELEGDAVEPKVTPTKGTFFAALMCSSLVFNDGSSYKSPLIYGRHLRQYLIFVIS